MFCYQCEQTSKGTGCTKAGVCGKDDTTATLQDVLFNVTKGLAFLASKQRKQNKRNHEVDLFVLEALFTTVTNVNFDPATLQKLIHQAQILKERLIQNCDCDKSKLPDCVTRVFDVENLENLVNQGREISVYERIKHKGPDAAGVDELITYGLKGMAAYADHAFVLGIEDEEVYSFFHDTLAFLSEEHELVDGLGKALEVGRMNLKVMEMLDRANTSAYGNPKPTSVPVTYKKGKAILVSGHDLKDLEELLKQTEGKNINIYTHGEMLPAHGYPGLKKYKHLVGNYGGAWQDQRKEFDAFPGAILMTTNCIQEPKDTYLNRIFTCGLVQFPNVTHIANRDFSAVISKALSLEGFTEDQTPGKEILVGFGHDAVLSVADKVVDAVKQGAIKHFFLVGGCDGAKPGRNYYTELAESIPKDSVILTLACGKYRFNKLEFGDIGGIPRLLDIGQCNDAYSAIKIASALANAFNTDVNSLPLSMILSWYEQKAVVILLSLLHLGIKNIRLGPSLPAFITPNVLNVLVDKFAIKPTSTAKEDLAAILG